MQSVLDDINKNSGVNAFFDSFTGKIAFTAKFSGDVKDDSCRTPNSRSEIELLQMKRYAFLKVASNIIATALLDQKIAGNTIYSGTKGKNASSLTMD